MSAARQILIGQILMIACCIFYIIWWNMAFRPGVSVNRVGGKYGVLLCITALCALAGIWQSAAGLQKVPPHSGGFNGLYLLAGGVIVYIVLLAATRILCHRTVTTELVLIVGWTVLELTVAGGFFALGQLSAAQKMFMLVLVLVVAAVSMVCYLAYYGLEPQKAFAIGSVPLAATGAAMLLMCILTRI